MNIPQSFLNAHQTRIGNNVFISPTARIIPFKDEADSIVIGDNVFIGDGVEIFSNNIEILDYTRIHKYTTIHGIKPFKIGFNGWVGQNCILDSTGGLTIGDNCGIGAYSQLWSHIKYGDRLQGCQYNSEKPLILEDDVWLVGHVICSPITAHRQSMALAGSVITKDMEENMIYAGCPAKQTSKKQFKEVSNTDKLNQMAKYIQEAGVRNIVVCLSKDQVDFTNDLTYFVIEDRKYKKTGSVDEVEFMKFLLPEKAKFTPYERGY